MRKLNHLKKFESLFNTQTNYEAAAKKLYEDLKQIFEENGVSFKSYNDLIRTDVDFEDLWNTIKSELENKGYTLKVVKNIIDNSEWLKHKLEEWNGAADLLMYKLYNDTEYLAGIDIKQQMYFDEETEDEDGYNVGLKMKYDYGWTTHPYGKLVIERDFGSLEKFMEYYREKVLHEGKQFNFSEDFNGIKLTLEGINYYNIDIKTIKQIIQKFSTYKDYFNNEIKFDSIFFDFPKAEESNNKDDIYIEVSDIENNVVSILYVANENYFEINDTRVTDVTVKIIKWYCPEKIHPYCVLKFILKEFSKFTYLQW